MIKTTSEAVNLVKLARQKITGSILTKNVCTMIQLLLIMLSKMAEENDEELLSLKSNNWDLYGVVRGLIQVLMPGNRFGGSGISSKDAFHKEIKVYTSYACKI